MISVIITIYNRKDKLERAIKSYLNQDYPDKELILIDDGSTDGSSDIAKSYESYENIVYFFQENKGCAAAKNMGVKLASQKYITFLDSDDYYSHNKVLTIAAKELIKGYEFLSFNKVLMKYISRDEIQSTNFNDNINLFEHMIHSPLNYAGKPPYFFDRKLFIDAGCLDEESKWGDTINFWRKFLSPSRKTLILDEEGYSYDQTDTKSMGKLRDMTTYAYAFDSIKRAYENNNKIIIEYKSEMVWGLVLLVYAIKSRNLSKIKFSLSLLTFGRFYLIPKSFYYLLKTKIIK
ncbi:glycosyltransferase [Providencia rettgeri]|uniref:glycosyltransferase family A protein n=1 Tax=Providencia sp. PROV200 TaxID=2936794 RepID=UPI001BD225BC|nr:glycosyltransferase family 2 protein [Providencia rettgeri]